MNDATSGPPPRLRHDAKADANVRALLVSAKVSRDLPDAVRARSEAKLDRLMVIPAAAGFVLWLKGIAVAACLGAAVVVVTRVLPAVSHDAPPAPRVSPVKPPPVEARVPSRAPAPQSAPSAAPSAVRMAPSPPPSAPPHEAAAPAEARVPPVDDSLAREVAMLECARALLETSPVEALAALDAHAAAFPAGRLAMERELLTVQALLRSGRLVDARARGEALLARTRGTIYEKRVKAMLDGANAGGESNHGER
jgi:hypothetical protein